jgi:hypothetical protein
MGWLRTVAAEGRLNTDGTHTETAGDLGDRAVRHRSSEGPRLMEQRPTGAQDLVTRPDQDVGASESGEDLLWVHVEFGCDVRR